MKSKYLQLSTGIFIFAIFISFLILQNNKTNSLNKNNLAVVNSAKINAPSSFSLEKLNQKLAADTESLDIKDEDNLTLKVANELALQIISLNANMIYHPVN